MLVATSTEVFAYVGPSDLVGAALEKSTNAVMDQLTGIAFKLLFALSLLQFTMKGYGLIIEGEIEKSIGTLAKFMIWVSFVVWMMSASAAPARAGLSNGADFIQRMVNYMLGFASTISGGTGGTFDAGDIFSVGLKASHDLIFAVAKAATGSVANVIVTVAMPITGIFDALMLMLMNFVILATCAYIAIKVFMVKLDAAIVIAISPLSFALNGLSALREQGMAPFKNLVTIIYRILILAAIVAAMKIVSDNLTAVLDAASAAGGLTDIWTPIIAAIFGYLLLAYMAHRSDGIANGLSSGSSMFSSGDMASSVAAGVAAGMAVASGGTAVAGAAVQGGQSMSEVIKQMNASAGEVTNASPVGAGGAEQKPVGTAPPPPPRATEMSLAQTRSHPAAIGNQAKNTTGSGSASPGSSSSPASNSSGSAGANKAANTIDSLAASGQLKNADTAKHVSDHLKSMGSGPGDAKAVGEAPSKETTTAAGSGSSAGIGGNPSVTDQKLDKLMDSMGQKNKPTFGDRVSALNDHVAKEQTTVQANINVNAHDH